MKLLYIISFFIVCSFSLSAISKNIVVVNIQSLIDNNINYIDTKKKIESNQKKYIANFELKEIELNKILESLESSKLILNENEINNQIENYNIQFNEFSILVDEFNNHYQNQIIDMREILLKEIIILLEKYAIENQIDLILDSTNYLIASNSINITDVIREQLSKKNIILEFKDFETN